MKKLEKLFALTTLLLLVFVGHEVVSAQTTAISSAESNRSAAKPVTIPLTIKVKDAKPEAEIQTIDLTVSEDGEPQTVLSIRAMATNSPITLAVLIQDDLVPSIGNETRALAEFIRRLPRGSRVMVGYIRTGTLQVRQKFTTDLEKAAKALRPPNGLASAAPYNPYVEVIEAVKKFESQPAGRRAILLLSDGLDTSRGIESSSPTESLDLQRAINEAQRKSIAVYCFYAPTVAAGNSLLLIGNAQSSLQRLSDETGGRAFFQGTGPPVSFDPFIKELDRALEKQVALTFLSTHDNKGFHKISVRSSTPGVEVSYPSGYFR
ncbi:MAG TPA: VWA domain-containing protein [Pyrinomonadaceae bacterium]|nr:VWA domain-containing protein [Pyrinomonadaceae bacterium]